MSEFEQTEDPRVLESIEANEVSLVDTPAIQRTFLIVKRLEDKVAREKIALDDSQNDEGDGAEKDAEGPVGQDASQADIETDTKSTDSNGDEVAEKADPAEVMEAASAIIPWLAAQAEEADGELKAQLSQFLEAMGVDPAAAQEDAAAADGEEEEGPADMPEKAEGEEEGDEEEEEDPNAEKSNEGWEAQLDAVTSSLTAVSKGKGAPAPAKEEEEDPEMAKSDDGSSYVSADQFDAFATKMTNAIAAMAANQAQVSKALGSFTPISKGSDDHVPGPNAETVSKADDVFGPSFFEARKRKLKS